MGGVILIFSVLLSACLWLDFSNPLPWLCLLIFLGYGFLGFIDDYSKIKQKSSKGLSGKKKLLGQTLISLFVFSISHIYLQESTAIYVPFFKNIEINLGWFYIIYATFITVGTSNAVNLTDGLDGLAIGPTITTTTAFAALAYLSGHLALSQYLQIPFVERSGELTVLCCTIVGGSLGFLWYNTYPAQVFMGDTGSLALGGLLGSLALFTKHELLLPIIGGIFVLETLSVITQVASFKTTGKRVFKMAPIHHHFELKGWPEPKVIVRFWIVSIVLALLGLMTLKLR
jgi:phospho-N-acetylmuramoyl-pentapeptide-transferase